MKFIIAFIFFTASSIVSSQTNPVKLPAKFNNLKFGTTTIVDLKKIFSTPDTLIDNVCEVTYNNGGGGLSGTKDAIYNKDQLIFHFKLNDTTLHPQLLSVDILSGSPVKFEGLIQAGKSTKLEVTKILGEPIPFNDPAIDESTFRYKASGNLICLFYFDQDKLTSIRIILNPSTNQ